MNRTKRKILLHYHIFKNAGTSVDRMLSESLRERWVAWDTGDPGARISPAEMEEYVLAHPDLVAVSSHQVVPPLPNRHLEVYPILFLRHPIDRAYSAYLFEWKKQKETAEPIGTFNEYILEKFKHSRGSSIEDFQTLHLSNRDYDSRWPAKGLEDEELLTNAKQFLSSVPFFGIVEDYERSIERMKAAFGSLFRELSFAVYRENTLQDTRLTLVDKLRAIRNQLNAAVHEQLVRRNRMDLRLYEFAAACAGFTQNDNKTYCMARERSPA